MPPTYNSASDLGADVGSGEEPPRKKLRTSHACDCCRLRKIRCDGKYPCTTCSQTMQVCQYGAGPNQKDKSDVVLEGIARIEACLQQIDTKLNAATIASPTGSHSQSHYQAQDTPRSHGTISYSDNTRHHVLQVEKEYPNIHNAVLSSLHTSATESVLSWPHFDAFPSLRQNYISIFRLEQNRSPLLERSSQMLPYIGIQKLDGIISAFQGNVNFWYPTLTCQMVNSLQRKVSSDNIDTSTTSCLALLTMALGAASQSVIAKSRHMNNVQSETEEGHSVEDEVSCKALADMYFDGALRKVHLIQMEVSATATQCLFFVALYFAYLQRPLQAWEYISATASKCRLLLSYPPDSPEEHESLRRIFWSCYILESDYLAELSALPESGIAQIESSIPLPGSTYHTHTDPQDDENSACYFLACISMRRLLNRVHNLLYARDTGVSLDNVRFPYIVSELHHQLDRWRDLLPASLKFNIDSEETSSQHGGFLRQRYLTCKSVIYRPYLAWVLANTDETPGSMSESLVENSKVCLDACLLHIVNLRGFTHTILMDTFICSLSMAGAMLILLAACRLPLLRDIIDNEVTKVGSHIRSLVGSWMLVPGQTESPSISQSLRLIAKIDRFIEIEHPHSKLGTDNQAINQLRGGHKDEFH